MASSHDKSTDHDILAKLDSKTKQIDELLAGFDNPNNSLNFIPSSLNKTNNKSSSNTNNNNTQNKSNNEITKTITITATSFKIEHHSQSISSPNNNNNSNTNNNTQPLPPKEPEITKLRPLPSPNAKPIKSCLKKTRFTTFRDEKRNKRRLKSLKDKDIEKTDLNKLNNNKSNRVSFIPSAKSEDGVSAKFYSSPQYLIRNGNFLRPKPFEQINNEKRLLQMLGAPEELAGRALPPGLLDEDWEEIYDPQIPNDYSSFVIARQRLQEWIQMRKEQRNIAYQKAVMASQYAQEYIDNEIKKEKEFEKANKRVKDRDRSHRDRDRDRIRYSGHKSSHRDRDRDRDRDRKRDRRNRRDRSRSRDRDRDRDRDYYNKKKSKNDNNNNNNNKEYGYMGVLPTQSPLEAMHGNNNQNNGNNNGNNNNNGPLSGIDKAAKILAKFGWKKGDGLGKSKQGLKGCLVPVGGYNQLMSVQDPTNILLLQNMASKGNVDIHLKTETVEECKNFGPVLNCIVHETKKKNVSKEQQVSVFVKFEYIQSCMNALQRFNGRFFDGRRVIASFFPLERFDSGDLDP